MTKTQFRELEHLLEGIDVLVIKIANSEEQKPPSIRESAEITKDFAALKQKTFLWIKKYITMNTVKTEKDLLQEIVACLKGIESVNSQYAPAKMIVLIRKLRQF